MKKRIALLLSAVMALSLASCGKKAPTYDELIAAAQPADLGTLIEDFTDNELRATETYVDQTLRLTGVVESIDRDCVDLEPEGGIFGYCWVYLPEDEIINLDPGDEITVVGVVQSYSVGVHIRPAYLVQD